jgi:hypothetical protein
MIRLGAAASETAPASAAAKTATPGIKTSRTIPFSFIETILP